MIYILEVYTFKEDFFNPSISNWVEFQLNLTNEIKSFKQYRKDIFNQASFQERKGDEGWLCQVFTSYRGPALPASSLLPSLPHSLLSWLLSSPRGHPGFLFSPPCGDLWNWAQLFYLLSFLSRYSPDWNRFESPCLDHLFYFLYRFLDQQYWL